MSDLRNQTPSTTYKGLLQVNDYSNGVDATSKFVQDGEGTNSALSISTTKVGVGTSTPSAPLDVTSTTGGVVFPRLTTTQRMQLVARPMEKLFIILPLLKSNPIMELLGSQVVLQL